MTHDPYQESELFIIKCIKVAILEYSNDDKTTRRKMSCDHFLVTPWTSQCVNHSTILPWVGSVDRDLDTRVVLRSRPMSSTTVTEVITFELV